ncbi:MAG TPA: DUF3568 family protein [Tepidisphaeraceae bacterium]|jgi:hypothetical protein
MFHKTARTVILFSAACLTGGMLSGCALLPLAALGAVGQVSDIGSTAFSAGTEVFTSGKLEAVEFCRFDQAQAAIRSTLSDLRLPLKSSKFTKETATYDFEDDSGSDVTFELMRRSPAICQIQVDVGMFGSEAYARLLLKSVRARLPLMDGRPATRPSTPVDLFAPKRIPKSETDLEQAPS